MAESLLYRVAFHQKGEVYEVYAKGVSHGSMLGFVELEELVFGERTKLLIDSTEERLKAEFEGVRRVWIPVHSVIRIDQVEKAGRGRITASDGKVTSFPSMVVQPPGGSSES